MPIYEYRCKNCNHEFSHRHERYSEPAPPCPECGTVEPRKLLSAFNAGVKRADPPCSVGKCPSGGCCQEKCSRMQ